MEPMPMAKQNDFLQPLLDMMNKRMDTFEQKLDANSETTQKILDQALHTNGRVTRAEKAIAKLENARGTKLNIEPRTLYMVAIAFVLILLIVASLLKVNIGGLL